MTTSKVSRSPASGRHKPVRFSSWQDRVQRVRSSHRWPLASMDVTVRRLHRDQADHRPRAKFAGGRALEAVRRFTRSNPGSDRFAGEARNQERRHSSRSGAFDLLRALIGVSHVASGPDWQQSASRLVDILITGSRPIK